MIEILKEEARWRWYWLSAAGRILYACPGTFPCNKSAYADAKYWRKDFLARANGIDHRQARCI